MQNTTILLQNEALRAAEASSQSSVLPAAFDTVNHDILLFAVWTGNSVESTQVDHAFVFVHSVCLGGDKYQNVTTSPLVYLTDQYLNPFL